jgi:hypothetical protein
VAKGTTNLCQGNKAPKPGQQLLMNIFISTHYRNTIIPNNNEHQEKNYREKNISCQKNVSFGDHFKHNYGRAIYYHTTLAKQGIK